jgi:hypothetical protein
MTGQHRVNMNMNVKRKMMQGQPGVDDTGMAGCAMSSEWYGCTATSCMQRCTAMLCKMVCISVLYV